jgi:hypothetical protein
MKQLINEYGLVAIAIICTLVFLMLWNYMVYDSDNNLTVVYNTDNIYRNDLLSQDGINAVENVTDSMHVPYFKLLDDSKSIYFIDATDDATQEWSYDKCLDFFSTNIIQAEVWNGSDYQTYNLIDIQDKVEIVITKLKPVAITTSTSGYTIYQTSLQDIYDKYGNKVLDADGNPRQSEQIVYNETTFARSDDADVNLTTDNLVIDNDIPCKYKVTYRVTDGTLKAEYTALFANKIRESENVEVDIYNEWFPDTNIGVG